MKSFCFTGALSTALLPAISSGAHAQIVLNLITQVDLSATASASTSPSYIGNNISAVAWNGSTAWVGGYNQGATGTPTAIVSVSNVLTTPLLGTSFGSLPTNNSRGITSLAVNGNTLAAAYDNGSGNGDSVRSFDPTTNVLNWRIGTAAADATRRGDGVAFDPGFNGGGTNKGVAYLSIGSDRRHLLNAPTGTYTNRQNAGAIINTTPTSTVWRDLTFDPVTGDLYTRESNRLTKAVRNGDNTFVGGGSSVIGGLPTSGVVDNENLTFVNSTLYGDFLILNDRTSNGGGQAFSNVVKVFSKTGTALTLNLGSFAALDGVGAYDFSFDASSQTLAVSDFTNRQLYVVGLGVGTTAVPEPGAVAFGICGILMSGALLRRRRN